MLGFNCTKLDIAKSRSFGIASTERALVRAMIRDGQMAFVGSQSLRRLELDGRREIGLIVKNTRIARKMQGCFEQDWTSATVTAGPSRRRVRARKAAATGSAKRAAAAVA